MKIILALILLAILPACVTHQCVVMPDGREYHAYLESDTEVVVGDEVAWNTKQKPNAFEQAISLAGMAATSTIINKD